MALKKEYRGKYKDDIFVSDPDQKTSDCKWQLFEVVMEHLLQRFPYAFDKREDCSYNNVLKHTILGRVA